MKACLVIALFALALSGCNLDEVICKNRAQHSCQADNRCAWIEKTDGSGGWCEAAPKIQDKLQ